MKQLRECDCVCHKPGATMVHIVACCTQPYKLRLRIPKKKKRETVGPVKRGWRKK